VSISFARAAALALVVVLGCAVKEQGRPPAADSTNGRLLTVYVAASLADVAQVFADSFRVARGVATPRLSVASSSVLARQIAGGAPADVFLSADPAWVAWLDSLSLADVISRPAVSNRIAVFVRSDDTYSEAFDLTSFGRVVVGDPSHVPVGVYARRALECLGVWESVSPNIIPAADARAALQLFRLGAADAAIGYRSDATFAGTNAAAYALPYECNPGIAYAVASVKGSPDPELARDFVAFVTDVGQLQDWEHYGFEVIR